MRSNLPTRPLGSSGLDITPVGFGAWAIGGGGWSFGWGPQDDAASLAAMRRALELGVNWIDTAAVYGLGHSEELVGRLLRELPRVDRPFVFTKGGLVWDEQNRMAEPRRVLKPESIRTEVEASLRRLGVERIDLYQFHWPDETGTPVEDSWDAMGRLVEEGKIRAAGVSNFDVGLLDRCEAIGHVDALQPPFSMIRREVGEHQIPWCAEHRTGVICYSPMQSGILTASFSASRVAGLAADDWRRRSPEFQYPQTQPEPRPAGRAAAHRAALPYHGVSGCHRLGTGLARSDRRDRGSPLGGAGGRLDRRGQPGAARRRPSQHCDCDRAGRRWCRATPAGSGAVWRGELSRCGPTGSGPGLLPS